MKGLIEENNTMSPTTEQKATLHRLTIMPSTSKNVLFPSHNHLLTKARVIIKVTGHQHQWLAGGYDLEIGIFRGG